LLRHLFLFVRRFKTTKMELENSLILKWEGATQPVCALQNDDGGGSTVSILQKPALEKTIYPGERLHGVYEKVLFFYPPEPRDKDEKKDSGIPDLDTQTGVLAPWVKLVIHWPSEASATPVMVDTVPINDAMRSEEEAKKDNNGQVTYDFNKAEQGSGKKERITKHV
jgi:hypothetical protein